VLVLLGTQLDGAGGRPLDDVREPDTGCEGRVVVGGRDDAGRVEAGEEQHAEATAVVMPALDADSGRVDPHADSAQVGPEEVFEGLDLLAHPLLANGVARHLASLPE
jgi:hypothetical protein